MQKFIPLILSVLLSFSAFGQDKLTMKEAVVGQWFQFRPDDVSGLQWTKEKNTYSFVDSDKKPSVLMHAVGDEDPVKIISLEELDSLVEDQNISRFPKVNYVEDGVAWFSFGNEYYRWLYKKGAVEKLISVPEEAENIDFNYKAKAAAYTKENSLYITDKNGERAIALSYSNDTVFGKAVSRSEFGIHEGIFWSRDGKKIAFYRNDQSHVTPYPLVDISTRPATSSNIRYPFAGQESETIHVGIYDLESQETVYLKSDDTPNHYLTNISWGLKSQRVYIAVLNRDQNHLKFNSFDAKNGNKLKTLFEEKHEKYVHPQHAAIFSQNDPKHFLWQSERDGYNHIYKYELDGKLVGQVSKGKWPVTNFLGYDAKGNIWLQGTDGNATNRVIYSIDSEGIQTQVTKEKGVWSAWVSDQSDYLLTRFSNTTTPNKVSVMSSTGDLIVELANSPDKLASYELPKPELFTFENGGERINARLIKPQDFDPDKEYPLLLYVYNGPGVQLIQNRYLGGASLWMYYFAQQGFMVLTVDGRGSNNSGRDFEQATFRQLGKLEMEDQIAGLNQVIRQGNVDENRLVVHGWSYGGFMTTNLMLNYPDVFTRGIAGGPVMTWEMYEVMYTERYMDTPETNPEGYKQADLISKAENLQNDLLVIHGSVDNVVLPQHSMEFLQSCVKSGTQVDFFTYPMHEHNVRGMDRVHLIEKVFNYALEGVVY